MTYMQDEINRIDGEVKLKKDEADRQGMVDKQAAADWESTRIRQDAEQQVQQIQTEAQNESI